MKRLIYKIVTPQAAAQLEKHGALTASGLDAADGYVHLSTAAQVPSTLDKYFAGHDALAILAIATAACGADLRWERARNGDLFPHLYAPLTADMLVGQLTLNAARAGLRAFLQEDAA